MKALTLYPEWAWAIAHLGKDIENRDWMPPVSLLSRTIAIHAGAHIGGDDKHEREALEALLEMAERAGWEPQSFGIPVELVRGDKYVLLDPASMVRGAIVATARLYNVVTDSKSPWAVFGSNHWMLEDVRAVGPFPVRGFPKLWDVPHEILREMARSAA